jgi:hypothetical protein
VPAAVQHLKSIGFWSTSSGDVSTGQFRVTVG